MVSRKGIILAGGKGTRLYPLTKCISKQLLPLYDKPMIYYPLTNLMYLGIRDILLITNPSDLNLYKNLLGDGSSLGIKLTYKIQEKPEGLAQCLIIGDDFLNGHSSVLILGDNIFHGENMLDSFERSMKRNKGATIYCYPVKNPQDYGVLVFDDDGKIIQISEKPKLPKSKYAVTGIYFFDETASNRAKSVKLSNRGEYEITSVIDSYLKDEILYAEKFGRGIAWFDTGSIDSLHEAASYIRTLEKRQGLKIGSPEELSWRNKWINDEELINLSKQYLKSGYGEYLQSLVEFIKFP